MKRILSSALLVLCCALAIGGNIRGRVICDGRPVQGVAVSDGAAIVLTDSLGRYALESDK
ncbi:MAG: metallophosphoesterase, partial [Bacteroidales bacterium]|nr:metallophosphoesterase [Bacteroidales bacterium]